MEEYAEQILKWKTTRIAPASYKLVSNINTTRIKGTYTILVQINEFDSGEAIRLYFKGEDRHKKTRLDYKLNYYSFQRLDEAKNAVIEDFKYITTLSIKNDIQKAKKFISTFK